MAKERKVVERIPDEFTSYETAAAFWDTHDTTDYPEAFSDVDIDVNLRGRRFEIDIAEDVMESLRREARKKHLRPGRLATRLLRRELAAASSR